MALKGSEPYDKETFFNIYKEKRSQGNSPNDNLEKPVFDDLLGEVKSKSILDLGCGDGKYGKELLEKGAAFYHGIDNSVNMLGLAAEELKHLPARIEKTSMEDFQPDEGNPYDLVISRLSLHYIEDLRPLAAKIYSSLKTGGQFTFSIEHPIITSCYDDYNQGKKRESWVVDNYFRSGERVNVWLGEEVIKYHRSLEAYIQVFQEAGFAFLSLKESKPREELFQDKQLLERRMRIPLFLFLSWQKG